MPTLNIDVNARVERAKRDLRQLDKEVLKISNSEKILERALRSAGDVGSREFKRIQSAAVQQAKAVNASALQFKQLRSQLASAGAAPQVIGKLTLEFARFRKEMERGVVGTTKAQLAQNRLTTVLRTTQRQYKLLANEVKETNRATAMQQKQSKATTAALARQTHALSDAKIQYKQLFSQMRRLGADKQKIRATTQAFVRFSNEMKRGTLSTIQLQKAQDRLKTSFAGTKRQLANTTTAMRKVGKTGHDSKKSLTGLNTTLENLGSTAVLVAGPLSGVGSRLIAFGAIAKRGSLALAGMFVALAAVSTLLVKSIKQFGELDSFLHRVNAILKATGKSAEFTAEQINKVASAVARNTLSSLEDARQAAAGILAFRGVGPGNLEDILRLSQDIASTGFTDLGNAAKTLARAVEDPVRNLDSLRRIFIQLDPATKAQIVSMQNFGERARAAGILLDEVRNKFGGAGKGANVGLKGAVDELGQAWDELKEAFGDSVFYEIVVQGINLITDALSNWLVIIKAIKAIELPTLGGMIRGLKEFLGLAAKSYAIPGGPLKVTITEGTLEPKPLGPISTFDEALIKAQERANLGMLEQVQTLEAVHRGYSLVHPEVLKLASSNGVLYKTIDTLNGTLKATTPEMARTMEFVRRANKAFLELSDSVKATNIILNNRTPIEKYKDALRELTHLYDVGKVDDRTFNKEARRLHDIFSGSDEDSIKATNIILNNRTPVEKYTVALRELSRLYAKGMLSARTFNRELERIRVVTPEVHAINSAFSAFGDKLGDSMVKGKDFVEGLKAAFKGLVDDILKEFLRLAVLNPIMNNIFGKTPSRPELGESGGGMLGIGGMFKKQPEADAFKAINDNYKETGLTAAQEYGKSLHVVNDGILQKGSKFVSGLGSTLSGVLDSIGSGIGTAIGGGLGSFLGHKFADLLGFQHGGQFKVGGVGGADSKLVAFKATPGEQVTVETPGQQKKGGGNVTYIDARGVDPGQMDRLIKVVKELDSSIEVRAINATADARFSNPSLFGRVA